jgi:hypothetical protein
MNKSPYYNALLALGYIVLLVTIVFRTAGFGGEQESVLFPIIMLSLLVLSVSVMAFLFFYQPVVLLLDGKREEALAFFLRTVGTFAAGTILLALVTALLTH